MFDKWFMVGYNAVCNGADVREYIQLSQKKKNRTVKDAFCIQNKGEHPTTNPLVFYREDNSFVRRFFHLLFLMVGYYAARNGADMGE